MVFEYHGTAANLAATCQTAFKMVANHIGHWDISRGDFLMCDKDEDVRKANKISVDSTVVISQFRTKERYAESFDVQLFGVQSISRSF